MKKIQSWQIAAIPATEFDRMIAGCRSGSAADLELLFRLFYGYLLRQLTYAVRDGDIAEEILQDFFVQLIESRLLTKFRGSNILQLMKFLSSCARNHLRSHFRGAAKESALDDELSVGINTSWLPENLYITKENIGIIEECCRELRLSWRSILHLEGAGYKHREIAEILNMKQNTVSANSSRAKNMLKTMLHNKGMLFPMLAVQVGFWTQLFKPALLPLACAL
ncbi:MAG: sigma-70 family RNA polymerase sigma factor [Spirochaetales bacterium]|nr:sigma-70 family RNA polymerase sigma factor [Spirochaetales bacterium]